MGFLTVTDFFFIKAIISFKEIKRKLCRLKENVKTFNKKITDIFIKNKFI